MEYKEIAVGYPQRLRKTVFDLQLSGVNPSDELFLAYKVLNKRGELPEVVDVELEMLENTLPKGFYKTDSRGLGLTIDFTDVSEEHDNFSLLVQPYEDSQPNWQLQSLGGIPNDIGENWKSSPRRIKSGSKSAILVFTRSEDGETWDIKMPEIASKMGKGENDTSGVKGKFPDISISEEKLAKSRELVGSTVEFEVIIDSSQKMHGLLRNLEMIPKVLEAAKALSFVVNQRPIDVSYGGIANFSMTVSDDVSVIHQEALTVVLTDTAQSNVDHEAYLRKRMVDAPVGTSFIVIASSISFLPLDLLLPDLLEKKQQIRVFLTNKPEWDPGMPEWEADHILENRISYQYWDSQADVLGSLNPFI